MATTWITPVELTFTKDGTNYYDVDVSSYVSANATGVILQVINANASTNYNVDFRKNGSSVENYAQLSYGYQSWFYVGIDSSKIFEAKATNNSTSLAVWLIGYFESEATFPTDRISKATASATWGDVDISGDTTGTALAAIVDVKTTAGQSFGLRRKGSSDNIYEGNWGGRLGAIVGVDASEVFQYYAGTGLALYLAGYLTSGVSVQDNADDYSLSATGSYTPTTALPSGKTGAVVGIKAGGLKAAIRDYGSTFDKYYKPRPAWAAIKAGTDNKLEGKIEGTNADFWVSVYFIQDSTAKSASDDVKPKITESSSLAASDSKSDDIKPKLTEAASLEVATSKADTLSPKLTEAASLAVEISVSDTIRPRVEDFIEQGQSLDAADTLSVSLAESTSGTTAIAASDTVSVAIADSAAPDAAVAASDTIKPKTTESAAVEAAVAVSDSVTVQTSEASVKGLQQTVTDTILVKTTEASGIDLGKPVSDSLPLALSESAVLTTEIAAADDLAVDIADAIEQEYRPAATDTLRPKLVEESARAFTVTDTLLVRTAEAISESGKAVTDTIRPSLTESSGTSAAITAADTISTVLSESTDLAVSLTVSDTLTVTLAEASAIDESGNKVVSDDLIVSLVPTIDGLSRSPPVDTILVKLEESAEVGFGIDVSDSLSVQISEGTPTKIEGQLPSDSLSIALAESASIERSTSISDTLKITLDEILTPVAGERNVTDTITVTTTERATVATEYRRFVVSPMDELLVVSALPELLVVEELE